MKWDLWLGTAQQTNYIDNLVPFNWRGWWEFGTGALGDMGCHIMGPLLNYWNWVIRPKFPAVPVRCTMAYLKKAFIRESGPVSSSIKFKFKQKNGKDLDLYWMDGGIIPERADRT